MNVCRVITTCRFQKGEVSIPHEYVANAAQFAEEQAQFAEEDKPDLIRKGPPNTTKEQKRNLFVFNTILKTLIYESWKPLRRGPYLFDGIRTIALSQTKKNVRIGCYLQGSKCRL